uniref:Uncharacterized protein n=1 Tax=Panagrolaimus sp. ES5 TaxID=591445 RepID=A0AC34G169_9BILA
MKFILFFTIFAIIFLSIDAAVTMKRQYGQQQQYGNQQPNQYQTGYGTQYDSTQGQGYYNSNQYQQSPCTSSCSSCNNRQYSQGYQQNTYPYNQQYQQGGYTGYNTQQYQG